MQVMSKKDGQTILRTEKCPTPAYQRSEFVYQFCFVIDQEPKCHSHFIYVNSYPKVQQVIATYAFCKSCKMMNSLTACENKNNMV